MHKAIFIWFMIHAGVWLSRLIYYNTKELLLQQISESLDRIKEEAAEFITFKVFFNTSSLLYKSIAITKELAVLAKSLTALLIISLFKLIKYAILLKMPAVIYLAIFDHIDRKRYRVLKSRGLFDAITCIFLFVILLYSLTTINTELFYFRESYLKKDAIK